MEQLFKVKCISDVPHGSTGSAGLIFGQNYSVVAEERDSTNTPSLYQLAETGEALWSCLRFKKIEETQQEQPPATILIKVQSLSTQQNLLLALQKRYGDYFSIDQDQVEFNIRASYFTSRMEDFCLGFLAALP
jgi:hypothetical protein